MPALDVDLGGIERNRDEIVWRIIATGVLPEQRTLAVGVVAEAFLDRLLAALDRGTYLDLLAWLDSICEFHAASPQIGSMLASATRAILGTLSSREGPSVELAAELSSLEQAIGGVAFKSRRRARRREDRNGDEAARLIDELLAQLESTDPLTLEHAQAVSLWCSRIAKRLQLSESEIAHVARCGLVFDFGKMKIPSEILGAPRPLSSEEWTMVHAHPAHGEELVSAVKPLRQYAATIRSHHERLDGKGYPDGLVSSQISLTTRIVSVADSFNAMIGRRPYRLPLSPANALDRLFEGRGTQFDPVVVEAMVDVVQHADAR